MMATPHPDRETAARLLAEEIMRQRKRLPKSLQSTASLARIFGLIDGLYRAALILNLKGLVEESLGEDGTQ